MRRASGPQKTKRRAQVETRGCLVDSGKLSSGADAFGSPGRRRATCTWCAFDRDRPRPARPRVRGRPTPGPLTDRLSPGTIDDMGRDLAAMECVPCRGGVPPLTRAEIEPYLADLDAGWRVVNDHHLEKEWRFRNFREALDFTNRVGELAEEVGHHPDIELGWGRVKLTVYTHKIDGLHEADFVFAAKVEALARAQG